MYFAGIDVGSLTAQAVVVNGDGITAYKSIRVKPNPVISAETVIGLLLQETGIKWAEIKLCISTGYGREQVQARGLAQENISEISCHGMGAHWLLPEVRTVIDIGGQDAKAIRIGKQGELVDFVMNDKCAAGTGRFLEVQARTLSLELDELGPISLNSSSPVELPSRCSIFCETDVLHYLQKGYGKPDIAAGVNLAMAERVAALVRRVGIEREITISGGVAKNVAVRTELEKMLKVKLLRYEVDSQIIGALGAAVLAKTASDET
jgi:(R)-2-hydroxyacyl-CoA dehydratese activating ATPase